MALPDECYLNCGVLNHTTCVTSAILSLDKGKGGTYPLSPFQTLIYPLPSASPRKRVSKILLDLAEEVRFGAVPSFSVTSSGVFCLADLLATHLRLHLHLARERLEVERAGILAWAEGEEGGRGRGEEEGGGRGDEERFCDDREGGKDEEGLGLEVDSEG